MTRVQSGPAPAWVPGLREARRGEGGSVAELCRAAAKFKLAPLPHSGTCSRGDPPQMAAASASAAKPRGAGASGKSVGLELHFAVWDNDLGALAKLLEVSPEGAALSAASAQHEAGMGGGSSARCSRPQGLPAGQ